MSVENKIREMMSHKLEEAHSSNMLKPGAGAKEAAPAKQGSSEDATIATQDDEASQGKTQSAKAKKQPVPTAQGAGAAPNFTTVADPSSVVNQATSKGNVHNEQEEVSNEDFITEEEYNALSDEEKAEYEALDLTEEDEMEDDKEDEKEEDEKESKMSAKKKAMMKKMKEELAHDVENLFASEADLSEDFKNKAASLFEAVVIARVAHEVEQMEDVLAEAAVDTIAEIENELVEKVDSYLSYVAEHWMEQNQVAIVEGLRAEVTEDFISGLKVLFKEHYIEVPEEKYDVLGEMQAQIEELTAKLNETISEAVELNTALIESKRDVVFNKVTSDLANTEAEKLRGLVEAVEFDNEEIFEQKLSVIKNNYFPKSGNSVAASLTEEDTITEEVSGSVQKYAELLSRNTFGK